MRGSIFTASIAAAALIPSIASAQTPSRATCEQHSSTRVVATVGGAGVGGVLGNVIAGRGDKTLGTIIGAVGGAIVGNQVARSGRDCQDAYGYYDSDNRWHASGVGASEARGYYDRDGEWIEGPPNGRYGDDSRWISNAGSSRGEGRYSSQNEWIPASANGYYDRNDTWVSGSTSGRYDNRGRWVADERRGSSTGYTAARPAIRDQLSALDRQLVTARAERTLNSRELAGYQRDLRDLRAREGRMSRDRRGNLSARNQAEVQSSIDRLDSRLRVSLR